VAPQNVHLACGTKDSKLKQGIQAPCETVRLFDRVKNDTFKAQSAVTTELDYLVGNITETLKSYDDLWENTLIVRLSLYNISLISLIVHKRNKRFSHRTTVALWITRQIIHFEEESIHFLKEVYE